MAVNGNGPQLLEVLNTASQSGQSRSKASLGARIEGGPETESVPPCKCSHESARGAFFFVTFGVCARSGKSTIDHSGTMQPDTTPGPTQEALGAPDDGHETAFFNVEKHGSSLGESARSTLCGRRGAPRRKFSTRMRS